MLTPSEVAPAVQLFFELYRTGRHSLDSACAELNARGYTIPNVQKGTRVPWGVQTAREILRNPVYLGKVTLHAQELAGQHEPLVDQETWDAAQRIRAERNGTKKGARIRVERENGALLIGVVRCSKCDRKMWFQPARRSAPDGYYACSGRDAHTCDAPWVRTDAVDGTITRLVLHLSIPTAWHAKILKVAQQFYQERTAPAEPMLEPSKLTARIERFKRAWLEGDIEEAEFRAEQRRVQALLASAPTPAFAAFDAEQALTALSSRPGHVIFALIRCCEK